MKSFISLLFAGAVAFSAAGQTKTNAQAAAEQKAAGYSGTFVHTTPDDKKITVSYSFMPLVPTDKVEYLLHTPHAQPLSIQIVNAAGKVVLQWKPEQEKYLHKGSLDVSSLKPGKYTYKIYWADKAEQSINFNKK